MVHESAAVNHLSLGIVEATAVVRKTPDYCLVVYCCLAEHLEAVQPASYRAFLHSPAAAVVANFQTVVVEVKLEAVAVKAVLSERQNHCSTIGQPFGSANSIKLTEISLRLEFSV